MNTFSVIFEKAILKAIGVAPITQFTHVGNKNSIFQGRLHNVVIMIFNTIRNSS